MNLLDMNQLLTDLAGQRPVFHSEDDFKHELAALIRSRHSKAQVRLETRPWSDDIDESRQRCHLDIQVNWEGGHRTAIELKYKTKSLAGQDAHGERYNLRSHSAPDEGRYDFLRDIERIESLARKGWNGFAVMLTNDPAYLKGPAATFDQQFRLNNQTLIGGKREWTGGKRSKERARPIELHLDHEVTWRPYRDLSNVPGWSGAPVGAEKFQVLVVNVPPLTKQF